MKTENGDFIAPVSLAWLRYRHSLDCETGLVVKIPAAIEVYDRPLLSRRCHTCQSEEFRQISAAQTTVGLALCLGCFKIVSLV